MPLALLLLLVALAPSCGAEASDRAQSLREAEQAVRNLHQYVTKLQNKTDANVLAAADLVEAQAALVVSQQNEEARQLFRLRLTALLADEDSKPVGQLAQAARSAADQVQQVEEERAQEMRDVLEKAHVARRAEVERLSREAQTAVKAALGLESRLAAGNETVPEGSTVARLHTLQAQAEALGSRALQLEEAFYGKVKNQVELHANIVSSAAENDSEDLHRSVVHAAKNTRLLLRAKGLAERPTAYDAGRVTGPALLVLVSGLFLVYASVAVCALAASAARSSARTVQEPLLG